MEEKNPVKENDSSSFNYLDGSQIERFVGIARFRLTGSFVCYIDIMARNIKRYYQAWELRQQKLTFKQIGKIMGITGSRAAVLSNHIDFKIENQKQWRISNKLKRIIEKYKV